MRTVDVAWDQVTESFQAHGTIRGHEITINAPITIDRSKIPIVK